MIDETTLEIQRAGLVEAGSTKFSRACGWWNEGCGLIWGQPNRKPKISNLKFIPAIMYDI